MSPVKVIICGSKGRMGRTLISCAQGDSELQIVAEIDQGDDLAKVIAGTDVIIDFSVREATASVAKLAAEHKKALVIGTTGHGDAEKKLMVDMLKAIPVVWSANFSTGVNTLFWVTQKVAEVVGNEWEAEVVETHHTAKKDAPSGTAKRLQEILKYARGKDAPGHALRIGDVVGDHTVTFGTPGERLELTHRASSRDTFARGALRAAKWAVKQKPGLYDMQDVLGLPTWWKRELILGCMLVGIFSSCSQMGKTEMPSSSPRAEEIRAAMNQTVIPVVDLENIKAEDALKFWDDASRASHPQHFKFAHVISYPMTYTVQTTAPGETRRVPAVIPVSKPHTVTVRRKNITSKRLLDEICQQANFVWTIMGREILIKPKPADTNAQP